MCTYRRLCYKNDCNICLTRSFASHSKSQYWSIKNIFNCVCCWSTAIQRCEHEEIRRMYNVTEVYSIILRRTS